MFRKIRFTLGVLVAAGLLAANIGVASAHPSCPLPLTGKCLHWDRTGAMVVLNMFLSGLNTTEAEFARQDAWNTIGILYNYGVPYHTDISVYGQNFGNTGWTGMTTIESVDFDWACWCSDHISHMHAAYNQFYGGTIGYGGTVQGVFCHEIGHTLTLDHGSGTDCLNSGFNFFGPHNNADFDDMYRTH
jgi:hypothetical protein